MNRRPGAGRRVARMTGTLACLAAASCATPRHEAALPPAVTPDRLVTSNDGAFIIAWRIEPETLPLNEAFGLRIEVRDARQPGIPLRDVMLSVDAAMPEHGHGMNVIPGVMRDRDGVFHIRDMRFHMPGRWELYFDVSRGGVTERAQVEVHLE